MSSLFDQIGLKVSYYPPLAKSGGKIGDFTHALTSYSHEIDSTSGYKSAELGLVLSLKDAETWYAQGLGRQIKVYTKSGLVWEGFVNQIGVNAGAITETRGPLLDIGNRASVIYTPVNYEGSQPVTGVETTTLIVEDLNSQAEFGIIEKIVAGGQCMDSTADQVRDIYLNDNSWPATSGPLSLSPGGAQMPAVTLSCLGNVYWLSAFVFEDLTPGSIILSAKIQNVITADPNGYLSTDFTNITANNFLVEQMDIKNRFGMDVISDLLNLGNDTTDDRRVFGIYDDRKAFYAAAPTNWEYKHKLSDPAQRVTKRGGRTVYPWAIRPGKWLFVPDFLPGFIPPTANLRSDPRWKFLESVRYSAPWTVDLSGNKGDRLSVALAKISYNGGFL